MDFRSEDEGSMFLIKAAYKPIRRYNPENPHRQKKSLSQPSLVWASLKVTVVYSGYVRKMRTSGVSV
jgi:hypothetical protein